MKRLDKLLITSFIPPFIVTFMIAIFVLLMQVLWLYIDDIAGKGLGFFPLMELLGYKCVALIPMALPLATLISSVMVLGNLAEHYELSGIKSAGVPLIRTMRPLMFLTIWVTIFSFFCSNILIPVANLKFGSRMYDIQRKKPVLRLDEKIFNYDFKGYAIHIGEKGSDDKTIKDVLIYNHDNANRDKINQITAERGQMFASPEGKYFVMKLENGNQYMESQTSGSRSKQKYPFVRTSFQRWNKVFDLSEFDLNRTNEELFKQNKSMLSAAQLRVAIDSIDLKIDARKQQLAKQINNYFHFLKQEALANEEPADEESEYGSRKMEERKYEEENNFKTSEKDQGAVEGKIDTLEQAIDSIAKEDPNYDPIPDILKAKRKAKVSVNAKKQQNRSARFKMKKQMIDKDLTSYGNFSETFAEKDRAKLLSKAQTFVRTITNQADGTKRSVDSFRENKVKHIYELYTKYSMAVVCFIFLFIGAPMGAIVRKGGFGYPILVSILFFMLFVVFTIFFRKIAESFAIPAELAAWMPCIILFPIGLILSYLAMNDIKLNLDVVGRAVFALVQLVRKGLQFVGIK